MGSRNELCVLRNGGSSNKRGLPSCMWWTHDSQRKYLGWQMINRNFIALVFIVQPFASYNRLLDTRRQGIISKHAVCKRSNQTAAAGLGTCYLWHFDCSFESQKSGLRLLRSLFEHYDNAWDSDKFGILSWIITTSKGNCWKLEKENSQGGIITVNKEWFVFLVWRRNLSYNGERKKRFDVSKCESLPEPANQWRRVANLRGSCFRVFISKFFSEIPK